MNQEDSSAESVESVADQEDLTSREAHNTKHNKEQMRTNVVQEIMNTERIYIKHLKDICDVCHFFLLLVVSKLALRSYTCQLSVMKYFELSSS